MGREATSVKRAVYQDGYFLIRLKLMKLDGAYIQQADVTSITGKVLQDVPYSVNWATMVNAQGSAINTDITIPVTSILDTPVSTTNDDGATDSYNFEFTFGPRIFPFMNRSNLLIIQFNSADGKAFFAPRIVCTVI